MQKVVALLWHPQNSSVRSAGGFARFYEIAKLCPVEIHIIDKAPSLYIGIKNKNVHIHEYSYGNLIAFLGRIHPLFSKLADRFLSPICLLHTYSKAKLDPDIIYVPFSELPQLAFTGFILKSTRHLRLVLCNLNINKYFLDRLLNSFFHKHANQIITISSQLSLQLEKSGIKSTHINGVGLEPHLYQKNSLAVKKYDAIYIGRHVEEKGIFDLLAAWNYLVNVRKVRYSLVTLGDIPQYVLPRINDLIGKYDLQDLITLKGFTSEAEKRLLIHQSRICVFPSKQEGWGIVPMEALASGLPVVVYNLPVYMESIGKTKALIQSECFDIYDFASKTHQTLKNLPHLQSLTKKWRPPFSWEQVALTEWKIICQA